MSKKILITGGAGYIGTMLLQRLLSSDNFYQDKIVIYDNLLYKQDGILPLLYNSNNKVKFVYGDVRDFNHLDKYLNSDFIIPLAAIVGAPACERDKRLAEDVNANHIRFLCEESPYSTRIIVPNTNSGYGIGQEGIACTEETPLKPISTYGRTKCLGEKYALESGKAVSLRLATVFGTSYRFRKDLLVNDFVLKALTDKYIVLFESHFKRNYIHVKDVASAITFMMRALLVKHIT